jgi:3-isopropylmalate dehydrogenase
MRIVLFPGDGIGPEILSATEDVLKAVDHIFNLNLELRHVAVGLEALAKEGTTIPDGVWDSIDWADGVILAPLSTYAYPPIEAGGRNLSSELRLKLNLGTNIRPAQSLPGAAKPFDLVICRENTEGFYAVRGMHRGGGEFMPDADTAFALRKITRSATRRVAVSAFDLAQTRCQKVTAIHKGNVFKLTDGLFLDEIRQVALQYPDVEYQECLVDAAAALLVRSPEDFDVLVTSNLFGDILSNQAAELAGGLGIGASLNVGQEMAMAQAAHGSAPDIQGQGIANPTALILSAAMLLNWFGQKAMQDDLVKAARVINVAVRTVLSSPSTRTRDLGGTLNTAAFTRTIGQCIAKNIC